MTLQFQQNAIPLIDPIFCGHCANQRGVRVPPESIECTHFSTNDPDTIWLAAGGAVLYEVLQDEERLATKFYINGGINLPSHTFFEGVQREYPNPAPTFKLPLKDDFRIHYKVEPHKDYFASVHGPESDPDDGDFSTRMDHGREVIAIEVSRFAEKYRLATEQPADPLYIFEGDREWILENTR